MSGPMGGNPGCARAVGKGQRRLMTKGIRMGSYVRIYYRVPGKPGHAEQEIEYEGKIVDKRVGGQDRESYVELENCMELDSEDRLVELTKRKRLSDAFIEYCKSVEKRDKPPEPAPKREPEPEAIVPDMVGMPGMMPGMPGMMPGMMTGDVSADMASMMQGTTPGATAGAAPGAMPGGMPGAMSVGMPGMMSGAMQGGMPSMMPMGGMQQGMQGGMQMMPGMMPMMPMGMQGGMQGGMPGMMMPMGMGMMPMGMGGPMAMMPMGMMNMGGADVAQPAATPAAADGAMPGMPQSIENGAQPPADVRGTGSAPPKSSRSSSSSVSVADVDVGTKILVKYQHPSLGKIKFEGVLVEKQIDGTNHDSFIQLQDCKQLSASGKIKNREESKKLMSAFINQVRLVKDAPAESKTESTAPEGNSTVRETERSRSRDKKRSRSRRRSQS